MARERDREGRRPDLPASGRYGGEGLRAPQGPIPVPPQAEAQPTPVGSPGNRPCPDPSPVGRASGRRAPAASLCERRVRATNRPCGRRPGRTPRRPPAAFQRRRQSPLPSPPDAISVAGSGNKSRSYRRGSEGTRSPNPSESRHHEPSRGFRSQGRRKAHASA